jgi:pyruvate formate lyase activating enzyme
MTAAGRRIDWSKCDQCLKCVGACIYNSLSICGRYMDVHEVLAEVMSDADFYRNSGGGMTVSGGEALMQAEFVASLMHACRASGIHTALETTGLSPWKKMAAVLEFTDLVLFDIKHLDTSKHRAATGVGNQLILKNLQTIAKVKKLWLRLPVIPGYNDAENHIIEVAELARKIGAEKLSLLPYHEGGKSKCDQSGRNYAFAEGTMPTHDRMQKLKEVATASGMLVSIGS